MTNMRIATLAMLTLAASFGLPAQDKSAAEVAPSAPNSAGMPAKVQVLLTEYDGAKKISSLPYTISLVPQDKTQRSFSSVRIGMRVSLANPSKPGDPALQYVDIGTNLDARARLEGDGKYTVELIVDRSSIYVRSKDQTSQSDGHTWVPGEAPPDSPPLVLQFRGNTTLLMRDGQTLEATVATDPLTGHVLKMDVTLNVMK